MKHLVAAILVIAPIAVTDAQTPAKPPVAAAGGSIFDKAVNAPGIGWSVYGANQTAKQVPTGDVPGGGAVRVQVSRAGEHPWDVGAAYATIKPVAAKDTLLAMVYLRAPNATDSAPLAVPISVGESDAPYASIGDATVQVGPGWKRYFVSGVSAKALAAGKARISLQLGAAKQVVDLGPAFLLDLGAGVDPAKLPHN